MPVGNASYGIQQHPGNDISRSVGPMPSNPAADIPAQQPSMPPAEAQVDPSQAGYPDSQNATP